MSTASLMATTLELERLEHRERRLQSMLDELCTRADVRHARTGVVPPALARTIVELQHQLRGVRRRLTVLR